MAKFPDLDSLIISDPVSETVNFLTLKSKFGPMGKENRKSCLIYPTRDYTIKADRVVVSQARTLYNFYLARKGSFEAFNYFDPLSHAYTVPEYVGTGDGETLGFNLPSMNATDYALLIAGIEQTETTNYVFGAGDGEDGADLVLFTVPPGLGQRITYPFTGRLKVVGTFADDRMTFETMLSRLVTIGLTVRGELNA
jgi:hypothetical protein